MSTLTLLRHGQASFGAARYDELSALGLEQARATGRYFTSCKARFDEVHSGPRERQQRTATAAIDGLDAPAPQIVDALDEFAEGTQILRAVEHRTGAVIVDNPEFPRQQKLRLYGEQIRLWAAAEREIDGVESAANFRARVHDWLESVISDTRNGRQILAATSAGVIAVVVCELLRLPDTAISELTAVIGNSSITRVVWSRNGRALESFNQTVHLPPDLLSAI